MIKEQNKKKIKSTIEQDSEKFCEIKKIDDETSELDKEIKEVVENKE
jgi:hypothetical protein